MKSQAGIKTARRNSNNLRYADNIPLMVKSEEELKSLLRRVKEVKKKAGLKFNTQKTKFNIIPSACMVNGYLDSLTFYHFLSLLLLTSQIFYFWNHFLSVYKISPSKG